MSAFDYIKSIGSTVGNFLGGDAGRIVTAAKTLTQNKNRSSGGASLFTKPVDLGAGTMDVSEPSNASTPDISAASDYESFLTEWTEIMQRFARYK
tara:strand:+ start:1300 stop:1584 length:285 start_codon:yes stop_codon:yes gene_type:complete